RANTLRHFTSRLAKTKSVVVSEDLTVSGLLKTHHLAQAIADVGLAEFRRQLEDTAQWYGCRVIVADRWFASPRTCSCCGGVDAAPARAERTFVGRNPARQDCGLVSDRDLNAALSLAQRADSSADSRTACGEGSAGLGGNSQLQLPLLR